MNPPLTRRATIVGVADRMDRLSAGPSDATIDVNA
jgi:hypothetical protein